MVGVDIPRHQPHPRRGAYRLAGLTFQCCARLRGTLRLNRSSVKMSRSTCERAGNRTSKHLSHSDSRKRNSLRGDVGISDVETFGSALFRRCESFILCRQLLTAMYQTGTGWFLSFLKRQFAALSHAVVTPAHFRVTHHTDDGCIGLRNCDRSFYEDHAVKMVAVSETLLLGSGVAKS